MRERGTVQTDHNPRTLWLLAVRGRRSRPGQNKPLRCYSPFDCPHVGSRMAQLADTLGKDCLSLKCHEFTSTPAKRKASASRPGLAPITCPSGQTVSCGSSASGEPSWAPWRRRSAERSTRARFHGGSETSGEPLGNGFGWILVDLVVVNLGTGHVGWVRDSIGDYSST